LSAQHNESLVLQFDEGALDRALTNMQLLGGVSHTERKLTVIHAVVSRAKFKKDLYRCA
jgi:hypothetical protein